MYFWEVWYLLRRSLRQTLQILQVPQRLSESQDVEVEVSDTEDPEPVGLSANVWICILAFNKKF
jgi:hypothetical protein